MSRTAKPAAVFVTLALAACGGSSPSNPPQGQAQSAKGSVEKAIYMSAADCADAGKLKPDICSQLIERTVRDHEKTAQVFKGLRSCEEFAGVDRCERDAGGAYRMRLQAFMFELGGAQPVVSPLYPSGDGKVGFRDAKKKAVDARDDNISVSAQSLQIAFENSKIGKKR